MKITVDISDSDLKEVCRMTGEKKKGPALRRVVLDALKLRQREEIAAKFISGEWGVELAGYEAEKQRSKASDQRKAKLRSA
jgi:hypothetical protein